MLHAHPNFRMFLTVDPRYGEISRAMRNRGVEVYMMQPYCSIDDNACYDSTEAEIRDVKRFLVLSGIPIRKLVDAMAKAHIYARDAGLHLGIHVTFLELTRWVQLFQHLIMNGNRPTWSLQVSWEHSYLSSFGEAEGREIVEHVKLSILLASESSSYDPLLGRTSSLPGGWPAPLKLRNFVWHSKEACIKQNCMYLEFLGSECASYNLTVTDNRSLSVPVPSVTSIGHTAISLLDNRKRVRSSVIPIQMLHYILFPTSAKGRSSKSTELPKLDLALTNRMLFFAANWTIEQANESDITSYLIWFKWYSSQLQPYCGFFDSFLTILQLERNHPIWKFIINSRREIISGCQIDLDRQPVPLFTQELAELDSSSGPLLTSRKHLCNAVHSVSLLRASFQQWNIEDEYACGEENMHFRMLPMLKSLRQLEEKVLSLIVESPCFDLLVQLYNDLLEHHMWFWMGITSFDLECLYISWCSLKKDAIKLSSICTDEVDSFLVCYSLSSALLLLCYGVSCNCCCCHRSKAGIWMGCHLGIFIHKNPCCGFMVAIPSCHPLLACILRCSSSWNSVMQFGQKSQNQGSRFLPVYISFVSMMHPFLFLFFLYLFIFNISVGYKILYSFARKPMLRGSCIS